MLISLFLVFLLHFLFVPCARLSWLSVSFLLHGKYTVSCRIVPTFKGNSCDKPPEEDIAMKITPIENLKTRANPFPHPIQLMGNLRGYLQVAVQP